MLLGEDKCFHERLKDLEPEKSYAPQQKSEDGRRFGGFGGWVEYWPLV